MKRILPPVLLAMVVLIAVTAGCQLGTVSTDEQDIEISLAPIHEVDVNWSMSYYPPRVFVFIQGGLADAATSPHEITVERSDNTVNITVTTKRPKDAAAAQVYGYFEEIVDLGEDFTVGDTYIVNVNGETTSFEMRGQGYR